MLRRAYIGGSGPDFGGRPFRRLAAASHARPRAGRSASTMLQSWRDEPIALLEKTPPRSCAYRVARRRMAGDDFRRPRQSEPWTTRTRTEDRHLEDVTTSAEQRPSPNGGSGASPAVQAAGLVKHYTSRNETVEAVRGVDLRVEAGEVFGFLGPNGAGKSTTVKMLTTLLSITSGSATVAGVDVASEPDEVRRRIGVALQEAGLDPRQTGRELLHLQARLFGLSAHEAAERTDQLLALVELENAADRSIKGYSGGMKRRLDLATALVHAPEVLFLDEPTTGLDPASRLTVWDEVRRINERGTTVFLTTQYPRGGRPAVRPA